MLRRDQRFARELPLPRFVRPTDPIADLPILFSTDDHWFFAKSPHYDLTGYSTLDDSEIDFGQRLQYGQAIYSDAPRSQILASTRDGVRALAIGNQAAMGCCDDGRLLTPDDVRQEFHIADDQLFYVRRDCVPLANGCQVSGLGSIFRVPLDGSGPPVLLQPDVGGILLVDARGRLLYSRDPWDRFAAGAGDGWIGDFRFMERGVGAAVSGDGRRVRFLEHAAHLGVPGAPDTPQLPSTGGGPYYSRDPLWTIGDLVSQPLPESQGGPGGNALVLARNAHRFAELPDGRVLAVENRAVAGPWNRLVVIDEQARTAKWVARGVQDFLVIPGTGGRELVVDVLTGASGYDIVRVSVPAR